MAVGTIILVCLLSFCFFVGYKFCQRDMFEEMVENETGEWRIDKYGNKYFCRLHKEEIINRYEQTINQYDQ